MILETLTSSHGRSAELLHERVEVCYAPMLLDLAVVHTHRVYGLELYLFARWLFWQNRSGMFPSDDCFAIVLSLDSGKSAFS